MKKFPKILYVRWEKDDNDDGYWIVDEDAGNHAVVGESVRVGVYKLEHSAVVKAPWLIEK